MVPYSPPIQRTAEKGSVVTFGRIVSMRVLGSWTMAARAAASDFFALTTQPRALHAACRAKWRLRLVTRGSTCAWGSLGLADRC